MKPNEPIRILHVLTAMNRAGAETMLMNLFRNIDHSRVQFDFAVSVDYKCDYDDEIEALGGRIIHYPRYKPMIHMRYVKWWREFFKNSTEYHIVHGHVGSTAAIYLKIAKSYGCYAIAHSHSTDGKLNMRVLMYKVYSYRTRYIADYFFSCSYEASVRRYGKRIADCAEVSTVLKNAVDVCKYAYNTISSDQIRRELGIDGKSLVIGTVGRFTEAKNPFFILDILTELKKHENEFVFIWVGRGELQEAVKIEINKRNLTKNVMLLGVRADVEDVLQAMNIFILPSKFEGLPVIAVEVQAAGVPLLCSDAVPDEVKISDCCHFVSISSTEPWVDLILKEKQYRRMNCAQQVIDAGYDIKHTSKWLMTFYENIVKKT